MFRVWNAYPDRSRYPSSSRSQLACNLTNLLFFVQVIKLDIRMGKDHGGKRDNAGDNRQHVKDVADVSKYPRIGSYFALNTTATSNQPLAHETEVETDEPVAKKAKLADGSLTTNASQPQSGFGNGFGISSTCTSVTGALSGFFSSALTVFKKGDTRVYSPTLGSYHCASRYPRLYILCN